MRIIVTVYRSMDVMSVDLCDSVTSPKLRMDIKVIAVLFTP